MENLVVGEYVPRYFCARVVVGVAKLLYGHTTFAI